MLSEGCFVVSSCGVLELEGCVVLEGFSLLGAFSVLDLAVMWFLKVDFVSSKVCPSCCSFVFYCLEEIPPRRIEIAYLWSIVNLQSRSNYFFLYSSSLYLGGKKLGWDVLAIF